MTHPSDIAGLSERLEAMTAFAKELSDALLSLRPLGGSECFVKRCGAYYADPCYFKGFIKRESDSRHEAMKDLVRERKDRVRAEQQRDEAYERAAKICDAEFDRIISKQTPTDDPLSMADTVNTNIRMMACILPEVAAAIRRLASGPEGGAKPQESKP